MVEYIFILNHVQQQNNDKESVPSGMENILSILFKKNLHLWIGMMAGDKYD